ncbi:unnamed protein product, partial [Cyprideis torosa]
TQGSIQDKNRIKCIVCGRSSSGSDVIRVREKTSSWLRFGRTQKDLRNYINVFIIGNPSLDDVIRRHIGESNLVQHKIMHTGEKSHKYPCGKCFICMGDLNRHTRVYTGEKSHECPWLCDAFSKSLKLVQHTRIHTGQEPKTCAAHKDPYGTRTV